jgi:hypothetical protein
MGHIGDGNRRNARKREAPRYGTPDFEAKEIRGRHTAPAGRTNARGPATTMI